jgi:hypothetical protein
VSSAETTTVTPSSLRNLSRAFRCCEEIAADSLVSRTASAVTCPVALPFSTSATTAGWARASAGSLRDVLDDTNYLSYQLLSGAARPVRVKAAHLL